MKLVENKYLKCFTQKKSEQLKEAGYEYLYESNGIFYFQNSKELTVKFSNTNLLEDTKPSMWINF
jgi:hypothetical protein